MKANPDHKNRPPAFHLLLVLALLAVLALGITPPLGTAAPQESKMYVANYWSNTISRADLDGNNGENLGSLNGTLDGPVGIALDLDAGKMYVTNWWSNNISRADLDGNNGENLGSLNGTVGRPWGIALDLAAGKMYVANYWGSTISRADLDGNNGESLGSLNGTLYHPVGIALDLAAGKMYVANWPTIIRADLDGNNVENLGSLNGTADDPHGIALAAAPVAAFSATPTSGCAPLTVNFIDQSTGNPASWNWTFGDGGMSSVQDPSHNYTSAGTYNVSLTVSNACGSNSTTEANFITVSEPPVGGEGYPLNRLAVLAPWLGLATVALAMAAAAALRRRRSA
jgi:PKD repeat protein